MSVCKTLSPPSGGDGSVLCKLHLRHSIINPISIAISYPDLTPLASPPFLTQTTPGDHLRLKWAARCRSCKPQHVPPHSQILTCHLILGITLTPLMRAYAYFVPFTHPPRPARGTTAVCHWRPPSEICPRLPCGKPRRKSLQDIHGYSRVKHVSETEVQLYKFTGRRPSKGTFPLGHPSLRN